MADERLEQFLTERGLAWTAIPWEGHVVLNNEWYGVYGDPRLWLRERCGTKAQFEYDRQEVETLLLVPFLRDVAGWHSIRRPGLPRAAYELHPHGTPPNLSAFADTDFFVVPEDWDWTMIHTHEDYGFGGPYFIRREWLGTGQRSKRRSR